MELLITFLTVMAYISVGISTFMIWMNIYTDYQLNHTPGGVIRQTMANINGNKLTVKPVGRYVVLLTISGAWLIASYSI